MSESFNTARPNVREIQVPYIRSDRIGDGHYIYWASLYAAGCLTGGLIVAAVDAAYRRIWR